ncbi:MAG: Rv3235 family protein [Actinomycetaceae bacterium]|nr:Rv3235 family protein [Actinomycetaceae bacterium]
MSTVTAGVKSRPVTQSVLGVKNRLPRPTHRTDHWQNIDVSWDYSASAEPIASSAPALPDPSMWGRAIALATIEILSGKRNIFQLQRWVTPEIFDALRRRIALNRRINGAAKPSPSPIARSSRTCLVTDSVAETTHVIAVGKRSRGVSVRLEATRSQWIVTAIEIA